METHTDRATLCKQSWQSGPQFIGHIVCRPRAASGSTGSRYDALRCNFSFLCAGHTLEYPLQYLQQRLGKSSSRVRLQEVGGQKARPATPVSSPNNEPFNIVARAIYETVQPEQVGMNEKNASLESCKYRGDEEQGSGMSPILQSGQIGATYCSDSNVDHNNQGQLCGVACTGDSGVWQ